MSQSVQCIISDGVQHVTPKAIASSLNKFFASIGKTLADKITSIGFSQPTAHSPLFTKFELKELNEQTVLKQLQSLKVNKAIGLDKISARLLKSGAHVLATSITNLLNRSICTRGFPDLWKHSKITALFKSGDKTNGSNYWPISILPTLSKILEKAVHSQLYDYLLVNNMLLKEQFGFLSTVSALSAFADEVLLNMEKGKICGSVFIDLTKAFDTVDHGMGGWGMQYKSPNLSGNKISIAVVHQSTSILSFAFSYKIAQFSFFFYRSIFVV